MSTEERTPAKRTPRMPDTESGGETFKREGPEPASEDTGGSVDEMNRKAAASVMRNIRPEPESN